MAGGIAWVIMAIIVSIGEEVANSEKQALYEENKLLNKENVHLKNRDVVKLAIENQKLREENNKQKE
jgi:Tfp pilus assembly protein PilN